MTEDVTVQATKRIEQLRERAALFPKGICDSQDATQELSLALLLDELIIRIRTLDAIITQRDGTVVRLAADQSGEAHPPASLTFRGGRDDR